jgi:hypothetical protein
MARRGDDPEPPEPIVPRQRAEPFFFARLEPALPLELSQLVHSLGRILRQILPLDGPVEERLEPAQTAVRRDNTSSLRLVGVALRIHDRDDPLDTIRVYEGLHVVLLQVRHNVIPERPTVDLRFDHHVPAVALVPAERPAGLRADILLEVPIAELPQRQSLR